MDRLRELLPVYLVLFAMVNAVGNLPLIAGLTQDMPPPARKVALRTATIVGCLIVLIFAFLGDWLLRSVFQVETDAFKSSPAPARL